MTLRRAQGKIAYPILVDGKPIEFQTDTGSDANILPPQLFENLEKQWGHKIPLQIDKNDDFQGIMNEHVSDP